MAYNQQPKAKKMNKLIEQESVERIYGLDGVNAIIEREGQRVLLVDAFGGIDSLEGGCVRWRHGSAYTLLDDDTLRSLNKDNGRGTILEMICSGYDDRRKDLGWTWIKIDSVAKSLRL